MPQQMSIETEKYAIHHPFAAYSSMTGNSDNESYGKPYIAIIIRDTTLKDKKCQVNTVRVFLPIKDIILYTIPFDAFHL